MTQEVFHHTFPNGFTLLAERMEHVRSAALNILVPAGCVYDPADHLGIASVLSDFITRGAGERGSRELSLALDSLGLDRDESVGSMHMRFWGATLARNLPAALDLYSDILRRPSSDGGAPAEAAGSLRDFKESAERAFLVEKLRENKWNISATANSIGTPRSNLYKKLEQYGISQEKDG